ncbi:MAG: hypothetical protein KGL39_05730 [Patescibacteria group bacterium]|nr:hypothetical protein [Patescibacteria group bacterium]
MAERPRAGREKRTGSIGTFNDETWSGHAGDAEKIMVLEAELRQARADLATCQADNAVLVAALQSIANDQPEIVDPMDTGDDARDESFESGEECGRLQAARKARIALTPFDRPGAAFLAVVEAAKKRIAELEAALKSISDLQPDDEYINLDSSSANYDDCYRDGWYDGERKAAIMARSALGAHRD